MIEKQIGTKPGFYIGDEKIDVEKNASTEQAEPGDK
jgi:hypothetical protein